MRNTKCGRGVSVPLVYMSVSAEVSSDEHKQQLIGLDCVWTKD